MLLFLNTLYFYCNHIHHSHTRATRYDFGASGVVWKLSTQAAKIKVWRLSHYEVWGPWRLRSILSSAASRPETNYCGSPGNLHLFALNSIDRLAWRACFSYYHDVLAKVSCFYLFVVLLVILTCLVCSDLGDLMVCIGNSLPPHQPGFHTRLP